MGKDISKEKPKKDPQFIQDIKKATKEIIKKNVHIG
jgi:hypothetical protein